MYISKCFCLNPCLREWRGLRKKQRLREKKDGEKKSSLREGESESERERGEERKLNRKRTEYGSKYFAFVGGFFLDLR